MRPPDTRLAARRANRPRSLRKQNEKCQKEIVRIIYRVPGRECEQALGRMFGMPPVELNGPVREMPSLFTCARWARGKSYFPVRAGMHSVATLSARTDP